MHEENRPWPGLPALLLVPYVAWFFTTPYNSPRLGFLTTIQFERLLAATTLVAILGSGSLPRIRSAVFGLTLGVFLVMVLSYSVSPYSDYARTQHWGAEHWKKIVFFVFLALGLRSLNEVAFLTRWTFFIMFFYEVLTWKDFLGGGAYVYQQGMKRICGTWSGGGLGSANGFGSMSAFAIPTAVFLFRMNGDRRIRWLAVAGAALFMLSIAYSGTRGAMIAAIIYLLVLARRRLLRHLVVGVVILVGLSNFLPQEMLDRYAPVIGLGSPDREKSQADEIAEASAESRIDGLFDGLKLGSMWPALGCGPEASPRARLLVRDTYGELALHNLYGQVVAELGWGGAIAWAVLVLSTVLGLARLRTTAEALDPEDRGLTMALRAMLLHSTLILLVYGMAGHNLYDIRWLLVFGCQVALVSSVRNRLDERAH